MYDVLKVLGFVGAMAGFYYFMDKYGMDLSGLEAIYNQGRSYNYVYSVDYTRTPCNNDVTTGVVHGVYSNNYVGVDIRNNNDNKNNNYVESSFDKFESKGLVMADNVVNLFNNRGRIGYKYLGRNPDIGFGIAGLSFYALESIGLDVPSKYKSIKHLEDYLNASPNIVSVNDSAKVGDILILLNNSGNYDSSGLYLGNYKLRDDSICYKYMYVDRYKGLNVKCIGDNSKVRGVWRSSF